MSSNTPFSFIGAADAYLDLLSDTGERTGLSLEGNCTEFTPKPDGDRKEQTGNGRSNWGQVIASAILPKPMTATIKFNQLSQRMFAAMFFGTNTDLTQAAGNITPAVSVTIVKGKWVDTGVLMLNVPVIKDATDTTTYAEDTDYVLNKRLGMIKVLDTSAIVDGAVLHMTGTKAAFDGVSMAAMTKANVRVRVKLDGQNFADGRNFISDIYQMRLLPSSNFSLLGTEFAEATFEGVLETPTGFSEPMKHIWLG